MQVNKHEKKRYVIDDVRVELRTSKIKAALSHKNVIMLTIQMKEITPYALSALTQRCMQSVISLLNQIMRKCIIQLQLFTYRHNSHSHWHHSCERNK